MDDTPRRANSKRGRPSRTVQLARLYRLAAPALLVFALCRAAEVPTALPESAPTAFTLRDAVQWALEHNPDLATIRRQHGIAAATVVIARTYPFNPSALVVVAPNGGPVSAGITNRVFVEQKTGIDVEIRGQGKFRREAACAALSRVDWEIAAQELLVAVRVARAANNFEYRRQKLLLLDESARFQQQVADQLTKLLEQGKATRTELLLARADTAELKSLRGPAVALYTTAWYDLRRAMGMVNDPLPDIHVEWKPTVRINSEEELLAIARDRRPDLHALQFAVREADARIALEIANRFGNPNVSTFFEFNETSVTFVGGAVTLPLPVFNNRQGEIQQRRAEQAKAQAAVAANESTIQQDIQAALARYHNAAELTRIYEAQTLPLLRDTLQNIDKLQAQGEAGADVARAIDVRRRLLRARDAYLDTLFELQQARVDIAAAVGDPLMMTSDSSPPK